MREFCAKALAQLQTCHAKLPIAFCSTRKLATEYALRWFSAVLAQVRQERAQPELPFKTK